MNLYNFKRPKLYYLLSSLAGPFANVLVCLILLFFLHKVIAPDTMLSHILGLTYLINAALAVINLIPVPPLDGSKIWPCIIPGMRPISSGKWGNIWFLVVAVLFIGGAIDKVITPIIGFLASFLP